MVFDTHQMAFGLLPEARYEFVDGMVDFEVLALQFRSALSSVVEPHEEDPDVVRRAFGDQEGIARQAGLVNQGRGGRTSGYRRAWRRTTPPGRARTRADRVRRHQIGQGVQGRREHAAPSLSLDARRTTGFHSTASTHQRPSTVRPSPYTQTYAAAPRMAGTVARSQPVVPIAPPLPFLSLA